MKFVLPVCLNRFEHCFKFISISTKCCLSMNFCGHFRATTQLKFVPRYKKWLFIIIKIVRFNVVTVSCWVCLQELANAKGNILENKELLESLNQTKQSSTTIVQSLDESVHLQKALDSVSIHPVVCNLFRFCV